MMVSVDVAIAGKEKIRLVLVGNDDYRHLFGVQRGNEIILETTHLLDKYLRPTADVCIIGLRHRSRCPGQQQSITATFGKSLIDIPLQSGPEDTPDLIL